MTLVISTINTVKAAFSKSVSWACECESEREMDRDREIFYDNLRHVEFDLHQYQ